MTWSEWCNGGVKKYTPGSRLIGRIGSRGLKITSIQRTKDRGGPPWQDVVSTATYAHIDPATGLILTEGGDMVLIFLAREQPEPPAPVPMQPQPQPSIAPWDVGVVPKPKPKPAGRAPWDTEGA